jgi:Ca2+-binding EF-hand superfamily protein
MVEALQFVGISESDKEILDRLFTMFDKTGDNQVSYHEFVVAICPFISGEALDKVTLGFQMYDLEDSGEMLPADVLKVLVTMNTVASYFGDPVMSYEQLQPLVNDIFSGAEVSSKGTIRYNDYTRAVVDHPTAIAFMTGQGQVRFGSS